MPGPGGTVPALFLAIAPPKAGIANRVYAAGPAVTKLAGTEPWALFHFDTRPKKTQAVTTQRTLPSGRKLAAKVKDLKGGKLATGVWHCVLRASGAVVATLTVRVT